MAECRMIVIRHGETEWNRQQRIQGHHDSPLTALGRAQAMAVGAKLKGLPFDFLYTSDLGRAVETGQIIGQAVGLEVRQWPDLRERSYGIFEGYTWEEARERYPEEVARARAGDPDYAAPGGESRRAVYDKVVAGFSDIAGRHPGKRGIIVVHGGVLDYLARFILGLPLGGHRRFSLYNGALNVVGCDAPNWFLHTWGDISHLQGLGLTDDF